MFPNSLKEIIIGGGKYPYAEKMTSLEIYVIIYEDRKIECRNWQTTITATLDAAIISILSHLPSVAVMAAHH